MQDLTIMKHGHCDYQAVSAGRRPLVSRYALAPGCGARSFLLTDAAVCFALAVILWLSPHSQAANARAAPVSLPQFQQLALNLRHTPRDIRADFAVAAIAETAAMYRLEYNQAQSSGSENLAAWAGGVRDYAARLAAFGDHITPHSAVGIQRGADSHILLQARGRLAILSAPRPQQQRLLEQRIIRHFCSQYPCDSLIAGYSPEPVGAIETLPHWTFRLGPVPSCNSGDGLELMFGSTESLLEKRKLCKQLFSEFVRLAGALAQQSSKGIELDWQVLAVRQGVGGGRERVSLNARDSLELSLPACGASPQLLARVMPWLRTKVEGHGNHGIMLVVTNTESLLSGPL